MCGICGIVGKALKDTDAKSIIQRMMDTLVHRGPDDFGLVHNGNYIFGHRRLSIIDLEHGRQPMQTEDGQISLVYNGEIYNYIELRQEIIRKGFHFKTFSDTEVLLKLYEKEGEACLNKLNGMFAFAVFDKRRNIFFAARDHFGIKPFYYYLLPDGMIVFASEIKAILLHPLVKTEIDYESLREYLTFQFCLNNRTLFKGIHKLEPGHFMIWDPQNSKIPETKAYWENNYNIDTYHTEEYFLDKLLILLEDSVRQQLRSDVPVGAYLSGGLDSSTIASMAGHLYGKDFQCFTGKFDEGPYYDESGYAKIVSEGIGAKLHIIVPKPDDFVNYLPKLIYHMDEPAAGPGLFPQYMVSAVAADKVKVVLGGQGGDEIFGGYTRYFIAYLEQCLKGSIFETQEEGRHIVTLNSLIMNLPVLKEYIPMLKEFWREGLFENMDRRYFRLIDRSHTLKSILTEDFHFLVDKEKMFERFAAIFNSPNTQSYLSKMLNFDQKTLLSSLLQIEDRVSMAVSLESRVPFLDHRIVQLANSMPPSFKFKNGKLKYSLSEAIKNLIPRKVMNRKDKMGFPVPLREWMNNGRVRDFVCDTLLGHASRERGIFNVKQIEGLIKNEESFGRQVWGALCLELWFKIFIDNNSSSLFKL